MKELLSNGMTRAERVEELVKKRKAPHAWSFPRVTSHLDIPYGTESAQQALDIYVPHGEGPFPVIVFVHGGGWYGGHRSSNSLGYASWALPFGYAVVSMDYRLVDEGCWPVQWNDLTAGLEKILEVGPELNLDTSRMLATGSSAGSILSLLLALKTKKFKCAMPLASVLDFANERQQVEELGLARRAAYGYPDEDWSLEAMLMGGSVHDVPEVWQDMDPKNFVDDDCPHILMFHGKEDTATPYLQTVRFAEYVQEKTGDPERAQYVLMDNTGHSKGSYYASWVIEKQLEFFKKYL